MESKAIELSPAPLPSDPSATEPVDQYDRSFSGGVLRHLSPPDSTASRVPAVITQPDSPDPTASAPDLSFTHDMIAGHLLVLEPYSNAGRGYREVMRMSPDSAGVERYQLDGSVTLNLYSILPDGRLKLSFLFPRGAVEHIRLQCQTGVNTFFVIYYGFFAVDGAVYKLSIF